MNFTKNNKNTSSGPIIPTFSFWASSSSPTSSSPGLVIWLSLGGAFSCPPFGAPLPECHQLKSSLDIFVDVKNGFIGGFIVEEYLSEAVVEVKLMSFINIVICFMFNPKPFLFSSIYLPLDNVQSNFQPCHFLLIKLV